MMGLSGTFGQVDSLLMCFKANVPPTLFVAGKQDILPDYKGILGPSY